MDTLVQQYLATANLSSFNHHSFSVNQKGIRVQNYDHESVQQSSTSESEQGDPNDPMLKYISQMLMEEDELENKPCMFHDCSALQAAEKSFYDVLTEPKETLAFASDQENSENSTVTRDSSHNDYFVESSSFPDRLRFVSSYTQSSYDHTAFQFDPPPNLHSFSVDTREMDESLVSLFSGLDSSMKTGVYSKSDLLPRVETSRFNRLVVLEGNEWNAVPNDSSKKKKHKREDNGLDESRITKQLASYAEEIVPLEMYDKVLLCPQLNPHMDQEPSSDDALRVEATNKLQQIEQSLGSPKGRSRGGRRSSIRKEVVDLRTLLVQCAQAVATYDGRTKNELLKRIRQHSSANGDGVERLAHYFANALEARFDGTGTTMYASFRTRRISAADILKGYQMYVTACPFKKVSNIFANRWIGKLASGASRLHIIDFGILYGFQWPCLIQRLSMRPEGPPMLRITGVDLPQPGLRPAERVEETGLRLARYCKRFNVPFEYNAIAKKWDAIQVEDFKLNKDELLVVNSLDRLSYVPDETVLVDSPRDAVLSLIKTIRPDLFIHGAVNGTYNSPFFVTRFREALFHFSSMFDMFEATVPRESKERALFEQEIFGRDALNVIACEGTERVDRPETYKQWQVRNHRAGFKQLPLHREIMDRVRTKVKLHYHKDFSVDEDHNWMLQGWKGRVAHALSCWVPLQSPVRLF